MEKYFDFEEAINCIKNGIPVKRIGDDGTLEVWSIDDEGKLQIRIDDDYNLETEYLTECINATNWTYYETDSE